MVKQVDIYLGRFCIHIILLANLFKWYQRHHEKLLKYRTFYVVFYSHG